MPTSEATSVMDGSFWFFLKAFPRVDGFIGGIAQRTADPDGVVVPQKTPDLANNHWDSIS